MGASIQTLCKRSSSSSKHVQSPSDPTQSVQHCQSHRLPGLSVNFEFFAKRRPCLKQWERALGLKYRPSQAMAVFVQLAKGIRVRLDPPGRNALAAYGCVIICTFKKRHPGPYDQNQSPRRPLETARVLRQIRQVNSTPAWPMWEAGSLTSLR